MSLPGNPESANSFSVSETSAKLRNEAFFSAEKRIAEHRKTKEKNANLRRWRGQREKPAERATMLRASYVPSEFASIEWDAVRKITGEKIMARQEGFEPPTLSFGG